MLAVFISDLSDTLFTFTIWKVEVKKPSTLAPGACAPIHLRAAVLHRSSCVTLLYQIHNKTQPISTRAARSEFSIQNSHQVL